MSHSPFNTASGVFFLLLLVGSVATAQTTSSPAKSGSTKAKTKRSAATTLAAPMAPALAPSPAVPHPPRPGRGPGHPGPGAGGAQALSSLSGTLGTYLAANEEQVYDAFTLKTSTGTDTVRFPRHLGQALMATAKPGSQLTVSGFRHTSPGGRYSLHLVSVTAGSQTLQDTPPVRPATPPTEEATTVRGTVQQLKKDPEGRTHALVLNDGTLLRLSPAAAEQLAEKLKTGASVAATGTLRAAQPGEVAAKPVRVVRAHTITLDGVQFLVR